ncbi:CDGSH iron-sulfur domain-containing protein [uncultured Streptomyces sp.]|uniref:CDGSH iron-sulfur domain-containing protein n=1 Tax=uncultured Streptomyces sp. TaxID=174707 RepID=UPI0026039E42|nr:CDGSH iron-sulfur domain-containing protein [uncultured Streptomyces sp.]
MAHRPEHPCRVRASLENDGPVLLEGPVEVTTADGRTVVSDRFVVALCACRRSRLYPWCDTSHRRRAKPERPAGSGGAPPPAASR